MQIELPKSQLIQELAQQARAQEALKKLRKEQNIGNVFERASALAAQFYFDPQNEAFAQQKSEIERELNNEILHSTVELQDFSKLEPTDPIYAQYLYAASLKEHITRELVRNLVAGENNLELTSAEKIVLLGSLDMANAYDQLSFEWHDNVVTSPLAKKLAAMGGEKAREYLKEKGALPEEMPTDAYMYMTFNEQPDGNIVTIPYALCFAEANKLIIEILDNMIEQLQQKPDEESNTLIKYFTALRAAQSNIHNDIQDQDNSWKTVDETWMNVKSRMQPLHMMESYDDALSMRVEPEYGITFIDERYISVNDKAIQTRENMLTYLYQTFGDKKVLTPLFPAMQTSEAKVYTMILGGKRLSFRAAAQNLPNRVAVKEHTGVKILQDMQTYQQRWELQIPLLEKLLGSEFTAQTFTPKQEMLELLAGVFVAGHEIGHNAFNVSSSREKIGEKNWNDIEENKSDMVSIAASPSLLAYEDQEKLLKALFAFDARSISRVKEESGRPYLNSAVVTMKSFMDSGILREENGSWNFAITPKKAQQFFASIEHALREVVEVYNQESKQLAEAYQQKYYSITPSIEKLMKTIGVKDEDIARIKINAEKLQS